MQTYLTNYFILVYGSPCDFISLSRINNIGNYIIAKLQHGWMLTCIACNKREITNVETYIYKISDKCFHMFGMSPCKKTIYNGKILDRPYIDIGSDWWDVLSIKEMKSKIENVAFSKRQNDLYVEWFISNCSEHIDNYAGPFGCKFVEAWNKLHPECIIHPY